MEMFWLVTEKHQQTRIPELSVTLQRVTKEHYVPSESDFTDALQSGLEAPTEEDYFASTKVELVLEVNEGDWMSFELGAVYTSGFALVERESEVV